MRIRYGVVGTGALGGYYGGRLAQAGREVHFLLRSDYGFVRENGLRVDSVKGGFHLPAVNAYATVREMPRCDVVLVCIKTTGNAALPGLLRPLLHPGAVVLLLQNGLGVEEDLAAALPGVAVAGGLAFVCAQKKGPGHIAHLDYGDLDIGVPGATGADGGAASGVLGQVAEDLRAAGVPAKLAPDLAFARWRKLVWNVPFNGLTVVMGATTDRLVAHEATRELVRDVMLEVVGGANAVGVPLKESLAQKMIDNTLQMTPYAPSMKLDCDHRRPMEIEYIYDRPVAAAAHAGFDMPRTAMLARQLRFVQDCYGR
ncbi:MAG: putative 2-dehydropantoate 2-reductase [Acidobacteriota bacterium]|jgi:2-dehydropantoate 2-reductase|nr:putative 2-dehydropantoate 2-reductase [Acidobacteriota bacterium]